MNNCLVDIESLYYIDYTIQHTIMSKSVVIYTYVKSPSNDYNLSFFAERELEYREDMDYIIVVNGYDSIPLPNIKNVTVITRENSGFDFGGHFCALEYLEKQQKTYDYYFFMNSSVIGPIMPHYVKDHWSKCFIEKINDVVKLVGTTIVCLPREDSGGYGPKIEGFFFMVDQIGLSLLKKEGTVFQYHPDKRSAIIQGEYGLSNCILKNGYSIDCMLRKYQGIDWRNPDNYTLNENQHPSRKNSFYHYSINPYEVIFHKWFWHGLETVNFVIVEQYVLNNT